MAALYSTRSANLANTDNLREHREVLNREISNASERQLLRAMIVRFPPIGALRSTAPSRVCLSCYRASTKTTVRAARRDFSGTSTIKTTIAGTARFRDGYFSTNAVLEKARSGSKRGALSTASTSAGPVAEGIAAAKASRIPAEPPPAASSTPNADLPHRRRQKARKEATQAAEAAGVLV